MRTSGSTKLSEPIAIAEKFTAIAGEVLAVFAAVRFIPAIVSPSTSFAAAAIYICLPQMYYLSKDLLLLLRDIFS